jgi:hypothetical protein
MNEGTFILMKSIAENIMLAQALVNDYHKAQGSLRCTLKSGSYFGI